MHGNQQQTNQPYQMLQGGAVQHGAIQQSNPSQIPVQGNAQNMNAYPMMMQRPTNDSPNEQVFPVRTFKIFGGVQIGLGVILCILSIIGAIIDGIHMTEAKNCIYDWYQYSTYDRYCPYFYQRQGHVHALFAFDVSCLILSGWFILTGFLPMCMSRKRQNSWRCLKIAFMVCSIIGASVFVPVVFSLGVVGSILRSFNFHNTTVLSAFTAVLSFAEVVLAIISASYCCCCTKWETSSPAPQSFMYVGGDQQFIMIPQSQIQGNNMQPVVMTTTQQQYAVGQQQQQQPQPTTDQACSGNVSMEPPPYKE